MKITLTKEDAMHVLDKMWEQLPEWRDELKEIKYYVKHSKFKIRD